MASLVSSLRAQDNPLAPERREALGHRATVDPALLGNGGGEHQRHLGVVGVLTLGEAGRRGRVTKIIGQLRDPRDGLLRRRPFERKAERIPNRTGAPEEGGSNQSLSSSAFDGPDNSNKGTHLGPRWMYRTVARKTDLLSGPPAQRDPSSRMPWSSRTSWVVKLLTGWGPTSPAAVPPSPPGLARSASRDEGPSSASEGRITASRPSVCQTRPSTPPAHRAGP